MKIKLTDKRELLKAALGEIKCDLAIVNTTYMNLFTGEIYPANIFIHKGMIVHVEDEALDNWQDKAKEVIDAKKAYIIPGFIDAHMHVESTMLTPRNFAEAVIPHGTTTVVTDPHEVANVVGEEAVKYMHDAGMDLPMRQYINIPSCVPAVPGLEESGAAFDAEIIERLAKLKNVIGLAEVMDFKGVENGVDRMMDIIEVAEKNGLYIQGHIPSGYGRELSAYLIGGPTTDHETRNPNEAKAKLRAGMYVDARESSMSHNVEQIWEDVKELPWRDRLTVCTDDVESADLVNTGHVNHVVRTLIQNGMKPIEAIKAASLRVAEQVGITNLGAVAPGYVADFQLFSDLESLEPDQVYFEGKLVAENGKMIEKIENKSFEMEQLNTVNVPALSIEEFMIKAPAQQMDGTVKVNVPTYRSLDASITTMQLEDIPVKNGCLDISHDPELAFVMTVNRYGTENKTVGLVRNFGHIEGAVGSTVAHDHHNLMIVYRFAEGAKKVYDHLAECGGGISCADKDTLLDTLNLPVFGLMSNLNCFDTSNRAEEMKDVLRSVGLNTKNPLLRIVTLGLTVIPEYKYSDLGLVDVMNTSLMPIFPNQ